ncbi:MAG: sulfatase-like hydrolase/transferase [Selenomonadaceae bacterium]|nr:sulfatase-like hydrolase/transferase [Selenomonadaceae bacterium]
MKKSTKFLNQPSKSFIKNAIVLTITYLLIQFITRITILITIDGASMNLSELIKTFLFGLIYDLTTWLVIGLPFLIAILIGKTILFKAFIFISNFITLLIAISQILFFREFGTNFNFIAVDYLIYTHELLGNIWQSFNVPAIILSIIVAAAIVYNIQLKFLVFNRKSYLNFRHCIIAIVLPLIFVPIIQSSWRESISENRYNVEIAGNGVYEFVRAFFANELDYDSFYATLPNEKVESNLELMMENEEFNSEFGIQNAKLLKNNFSEKPNVIMITVESLNADYLKIFGGNGLTPYLDELVNKSYVFTRMYATGTRTVRGLEAVTLSLPPTPGQSIVRREDNNDLSSLGDAFKQNGYARDFIYGGYGYFDNMNKFFEGNGYTVKDRTSIPDNEIFHETIWGVADEILFTQVLKSMDDHFSKNEPAFEMVMTTSNHRPFTFPADRIDIEDGTRPAAVKYTDWAINDFLERAKSHEWFDNTIFVIVADHQALAAGKSTLPINCYHIPCLIYAPKLIAPGKSDRLISQMDLAPTLLGMLNLSYNEKFLGHDINKISADDERIFISTYQMLGYVKNDILTILTPDKKAAAYHIDDWTNATYSAVEIDPQLLNEAITYYQGASYLFKNGKLKVK